MKNCEIDWDLAPEWCVAHGLKGTVMGIKEFWLGDEMYQSLDQKKAFLYGEVGDSGSGHFYNNRRNSFSYVKPRPAAWNGEGPPPAGVKFEACNRGDGNWRKAVMLFVGKELGVMRLDTGPEYSFYVNEWEYRPIRTTEQIAAEERAEAIDKMVEFFVNYYENPKGSEQYLLICRQLHDAGYRKQVKP